MNSKLSFTFDNPSLEFVKSPSRINPIFINKIRLNSVIVITLSRMLTLY